MSVRGYRRISALILLISAVAWVALLVSPAHTMSHAHHPVTDSGASMASSQMLLVNPANGINATLYKNLNFEFIRDVAPVAGLVRTPNVMEVTPSLPVKTVAEFIAYCKANPGKINMASSGSGTSVHLSGELFKSMSRIDIQHIPYKGGGQAVTNVLGGHVDMAFSSLAYRFSGGGNQQVGEGGQGFRRNSAMKAI